jgi:LysM repeat protein
MMPDSTGPQFIGKKFVLSLTILSFFLFPLALSGCKEAASHSARARLNITQQARSYQTIVEDTNRSQVNSILKTAFSQYGVPYRYGGSSPETGFDCSGFVSWVYKQYGVDLPRSSRAMMTAGTPIEKADLRPGDLVFFNYGYSHVGIYTGNDKYIHSPRTGKSIEESDLNGRGRKEHYVGARRVIDNRGVHNISDSLKAEWVKQSRYQTKLAMNDRAATRATGAKANYSRPKSTASKGKGKNRSYASSKKPSGQKTAKSSGSHKVKSGDTMYDLAKRYGVSTSDLVAHNGLGNGNKLKPGQTIKIPDKSKPKAKASGKSASAKGSKAKSSKKAPSKGKSQEEKLPKTKASSKS